MYKRRFVADLEPGERVGDLFVATEKELARTQSGKVYLRLALSDRTGRLPAVAWEDAEAIYQRFEDGSVVHVEGEVTTYRGQTQLTVFHLRPARPEEVEEEAYLPVSRYPLEAMAAELDEVVVSVQDPWLQALLQRFFGPDSPTRAQFLRQTAATGVHHAYLGGLLEHVLEMVRIARTLAALHPEYVNEDLIVSAVLLHDIGKLDEYTLEAMTFRQTDLGRLYGHLYLGARRVEEAIAEIEGFPPALAQELIHCILSHHGLLEHGAVALPQTLNAQIVHYADLVSARLNQFRQLLEGRGRREAHEAWTEFDRLLGLRAYRGFLNQEPSGGPGEINGLGRL